MPQPLVPINPGRDTASNPPDQESTWRRAFQALMAQRGVPNIPTPPPAPTPSDLTPAVAIPSDLAQAYTTTPRIRPELAALFDLLKSGR